LNPSGEEAGHDQRDREVAAPRPPSIEERLEAERAEGAEDRGHVAVGGAAHDPERLAGRDQPVRVGNPDSRSDSPGTIGRCGLSSTSSPEPSPVSSSAPDSLNQTTAPRITVPVPVSPLDVRRRDLLGGLIHEYYRVAA